MLCSGCSISKDLNHKPLYTPTEVKQLEKCNTAKFAWYMSYTSKRVVFLTNLLRVNPSLLSKYIDLQTDSSYRNNIRYNTRVNKRATTNLPEHSHLLRPSFGLFMASKIHSVHSGLNGQMGHQNLNLRLRLSLNFNRIYGENVCYGYYTYDEIVIGWIESSGHYSNLVEPRYYRIGVSGFRHKEMGVNYVQVFSGKKFFDLFRNQ